MWIGQYWKAEEFDCPCCKTGGADMDRTLISILDIVRKTINPPGGLRCNSGYRCNQHNIDVGGKPESYHRKHMAADITYARPALRNQPNILRLYITLEDVARRHCPNGVGLGLYNTFVHIDVRGSISPTRNSGRWFDHDWPRF